MTDHRLTRCPHCRTCFQITQPELDKAQGAVRCGHCKKIYNAAFHLLTDEETLEASAADRNIRPDTASENQTGGTVTAPEPNSDATADQENPLSHLTFTKTQAATEPQHPEPKPTPQQKSQTATPSPDNLTSGEAPDDPLAALPDTPDIQFNQEELAAIRQARQAPQVRQQQLEVAMTAEREETPPAFSQNIHLNAETATSGTQTTQQAADLQAKLRGLPWVPATLAAALVLLILMLTWGNTRTLSQSPGLAGFAEAICSLSSCEHFLPSDFQPIEADQQEILQQGTRLFADLILQNTGTSPLPFPAILVEFRDARGKILAEKLYQPSNYLSGMPFPDQILQPDLPVALSLPIEAKINQLSNFSVRYFPPPGAGVRMSP